MSDFTTYDGLPIAKDPPCGASIIVYREKPEGIEFLLLHRAHSGRDFEGEWAWAPPAGARQPDEEIQACAERELLEEVGLSLPLQRTDFGSENWCVYAAKVGHDCQILLDQEHDRYEWVSIEEVSKCKPEFVADHFHSIYATLRD